MTQKHFVAIANILVSLQHTQSFESTVQAFADALAEQNPKFNRARFYAYIQERIAQ